MCVQCYRQLLFDTRFLTNTTQQGEVEHPHSADITLVHYTTLHWLHYLTGTIAQMMTYPPPITSNVILSFCVISGKRLA